jgi:hypothetical protein
MFCPQCGVPNDDDSVFCGNCGAVLNPDEILDDEPAGAEVEGARDLDESGPEEIEAVAEQPAYEPPSPPPVPVPPRVPPVPPATSPPTSGLAVASLLLGIGGLTILPLLGSIAAIILGYMARSEIRRSPGRVGGEGVATAGIVLGWISVGVSVLIILFVGGLGLCGLCGVFGASSY